MGGLDPTAIRGYAVDMKPFLLWLRCWLWYGGHDHPGVMGKCKNCGRPFY